MQKLCLKDFEYHIPAATRQAAEALLRARAIKQLQEVERHFWVTTFVVDHRPLEAEVIITPSRIKAFACECWEEGRRLMCPHIAAALFKIRQYLDQKAQERQAKVREQEEVRAHRLSTRNILERVEHSELKAFVHFYAERDVDFALALKAYFAAHMSAPEVVEGIYASLLQAVLPKVASGRSLKPSEMRRARLVLDTLMHQIETAPPSASFCGNAAVLRHLSEHAAVAEPPHRQWLIAYCRDAFHRLTHSERLTPEQRAQARLLLLDLITGAPYPEELMVDTLALLARAARDDDFYRYIRQKFDEAQHPLPTPILHLFCLALAERDCPSVMQRVLEAHFEEPERVVHTLELLDRLGYSSAILETGIALLHAHSLPLRRQIALEELLLDAAEKVGHTDMQALLLRRRFYRQGDEHTLLCLKQSRGPQWSTECEDLLADLCARSNWQQAALILAREENLDALEDLLRRCLDPNLLQQYEHLFLPERSEFVGHAYIEALSTYLNDHFGKPAAEYVGQYIEALAQKKYYALAARIVQSLVERFPERQYLSEQLLGMLPKAYWPVLSPSSLTAT